MKIDQSLQEVWDWKEKVYEENKGKSLAETIKNMRAKAELVRKKYNIRPKKQAVAGK